MKTDETDRKWVSSRDENRFQAHKGYDTRGEAITHAAEELGIEEGDTFYTGRATALLLPNIAPDTIIEQFQIEIEDDGAEDGADALDVSAEEEADLGVMLNKTVDEWAEKHGIKVNAYRVDDVETHVIGAPDGEERPEQPPPPDIVW